jgi:hypothetical protein
MTDPLSFAKALRLTDDDVEAEVMDAAMRERGYGWRVVAGAVSLTEQMARRLILPLAYDPSFDPRPTAPAPGVFSNSWGPPQPNPLTNLIKSLDAIAALPPASKPLRIVECRDLGSGRLYQERFRFSGGVNMSAIARNTERRIEAESRDGTVYIEKATGNVYCSPKAAARLIEQFPDAPRGPEPLALSWTVPMNFESTELMWKMAGRYV